ncbi:Allergen Fus c 3 [Fusarium oxysporum f. sp. albedinis]|nr:Allergen Fus c 3 [Fusarium oxysporum f. sp. albedinis]
MAPGEIIKPIFYDMLDTHNQSESLQFSDTFGLPRLSTFARSSSSRLKLVWSGCSVVARSRSRLRDFFGLDSSTWSL